MSADKQVDIKFASLWLADADTMVSTASRLRNLLAPMRRPRGRAIELKTSHGFCVDQFLGNEK